MSKKVIGYKAMNKDMTCRGFQFEVGETYTINGELELCCTGFHFCKCLKDVFLLLSKRRLQNI